MHSKCYLPDMSHGYAFMQHFTDISIFFPLKKKNPQFMSISSMRARRWKVFWSPLDNFSPSLHFYGIYAHINSPSCCLEKPFAEIFFLLFHPIQPQPTSPKKHILFYLARSVLWHRQSTFLQKAFVNKKN